MKKLFFAVLATVAMVACTTDELVSVKGGDAIAFQGAFIDNATRAAADPSTTTGSIENFDVWAFMDEPSGTVFADEDVTKVGADWTYTNTQYWSPDHKYYFAALSPMNSANWNLNTAGMNTLGAGVVDFANVDGSEDLLYATAMVQTSPDINVQPEAVKFKFDHLLSKVKFTFENGFVNDNAELVVKNITMKAAGGASINLAQDKAAWAWVLAAGFPQVELNFGDVARLAMGANDECAKERLSIPADATYSYDITFDVELYMGDVLAQTFNETTTLTGVALEMGKAYNFKANLNPANLGLYPITFEVEEVVDWVNAGDVEVALNHSVVTNNQELEDALDLNEREINITLNADAAVDVTAWATFAFGGASTEVINIDGNGYTLTFNQTNSDWNNVSTANNAKLNIKNAHLTSTGYNDGPWNRHDLNFACDVTLTDVTTDKAIALKAGGTLNNVTIADANTSDTYALWIQPNGQTVTLDNCVIDMLAASDGRGIKIDNQYVTATEQRVTLNVKNTTFKTEEKSAILVKSAVGAEVNVENIDITEVAADQQYAVWVDEATKTYANLVNVTGALCRVEGTTVSNSTAADQSGLDSAMGSATNVNVELGDGNYSLPGATDKNIVISGDEGAVITVNKPAFHGSNVTFDGVTVVGSGYSTGVQHVNVVTYNDATIKGEMCLYGEKVVFNGCTFELANQYIWTYGAKVVEFNNCTFNTEGKAILVYNEGAGASDVKVNGCTFNATQSRYAGTISNLACAAIEIDNHQNSGVGTAHKVTTSGNTYNTTYFSGEWRIKKFVAGNAITVNGVEYTNMALDGRTMTFTSGTEVTVE